MIEFIESSQTSTALHIVTKEQIQTHIHATLFSDYHFEGKIGESFMIPEKNELYIGGSFEHSFVSIDPYNTIDWLKMGAQIGGVLAAFKRTTITISTLPPTTTAQQVSQLLLGISQKTWKFTKYKKQDPASIHSIGVSFGPDYSELLTHNDIVELFALDQGITLARSTVEDTPEAINPKTLPLLIKKELGHYPNVTITTKSYSELEDEGFQGICMVGRSSRYKPVLSHVILKPNKAVKKTIVLIGKGLTYDSGGLDIKTNGYMQTMKCDMAGSAKMFGVVKALAEMKLLEHTEVHWLSAFAENMVGPDSYKADDVITSYSGQTIEVFNTDAEGRLTLADCLSYATTLSPDIIIDAATLTGACVGAVTEYCSALMGNNKELIGQLEHAFQSEGERIQHTPMPEILREWVKGDIADLNNTATNRQAGHITAGLFLSHFVDQNLFRGKKFETLKEKRCYSWAHIDIAGTAHNKKNNSLGVSGATGHGVRSIVRYLTTLDNG
jgi:leucyl aminopeptidase